VSQLQCDISVNSKVSSLTVGAEVPISRRDDIQLLRLVISDTSHTCQLITRLRSKEDQSGHYSSTMSTAFSLPVNALVSVPSLTGHHKEISPIRNPNVFTGKLWSDFFGR